MKINGECVSADLFPPWHFVEMYIGSELRVGCVVHHVTDTGAAPFWFDDPENPQRAWPLLTFMRPRNLGDYGSILNQASNLQTFVALCKAVDDLPSPLVAVQCLRWLVHYGPADSTKEKSVVREAHDEVQKALKRRRKAYDAVLERLCGSRAIG